MVELLSCHCSVACIIATVDKRHDSFFDPRLSHLSTADCLQSNDLLIDGKRGRRSGRRQPTTRYMIETFAEDGSQTPGIEIHHYGC
jgi:hypothetical protein